MVSLVKVSVSGGQARITIPKDLAVKLGFITEGGEKGEKTYVVIKRMGRRLEIIPGKLEEEVRSNV